MNSTINYVTNLVKEKMTAMNLKSDDKNKVKLPESNRYFFLSF